jgi:NAD(P)-dependent dehydrogenase (short-subunit alcohol dehydrogenase family)
MNVNVTGTFLTAKHASRIFIENGIKGSIVLIASMSGQIANRGLTCTAYNTSKSAVHQLCRSMAQEIGAHGIRINTLSPGWLLTSSVSADRCADNGFLGYIRTAMTDELLAEKPDLEETWMRGALLGRLGAPEDFKAPAVFLLASGSSFMTGADLRVDGGHCASA